MAAPRRRQRRPLPPSRAVGDLPRPLRVYDVAVWGADDALLAGRRWRTAAGRWRTTARQRGSTAEEVWRALPAPPDGPMATTPADLHWMLFAIQATTADLPALAEQARRAWPELFTDGWPDELGN